MPAPYCLAIDIGTSRTAAAIARTTPSGVIATSVPLGRASDNAPTAVYVGEGELLFGDAAERRGASAPGRLIREFKRRIGDDVPILAGDRSFAPEELYALTVDWAARIVIEREGKAPDRLAVTVPAAWGEYRSEMVRSAVAAQGWRDIDIVTEPEAAARHYESTNPLPAGHALAVYDFGGGTFDAIVLRKDDAGEVRIVGSPAGIGDLGGADFDDAVVRHIVAAAKVDATTLAGDTAGRMALAALRRECVEAKESLSFDSEAVIPVILGGDQRTVRLTRDEFEVMIAGDLDRTADVLEDAVIAAGVAGAGLDAILLTGGSSRIPRVAQVMSERFDRPIAIDADPKAIIALGAARVASAVAGTAAADATVVIDTPAGADDELEALQETGGVSNRSDRRRSWFRRLPATTYVAGALAVLITGAAIATAPALGNGTADLPQQAAGESVASTDPVLSDLSLFSPPVFDAAPVVKTFAPEEVPLTDQQDTAEPRTPRSPSKPVARASSTEPGGAAAKGPKQSSGSSDTATKPEGSSATTTTPTAPKPETPAPGTGTPDPVTPSPEPSTPGTATPEPEPSNPGPVDPTPEPNGPATPAPEPTTPAPATPEPAPSDPQPDPATSSAPEPVVSEV